MKPSEEFAQFIAATARAGKLRMHGPTAKSWQRVAELLARQQAGLRK